MQTPSHHAPAKSGFPDEQISASSPDAVGILVTQRHLMVAAGNMRPSVSPAERFKYQQMYARSMQNIISAVICGKTLTTKFCRMLPRYLFHNMIKI